ncbi:family 10 glycosylhydrolase [Catellatospora sp. KI3]|uniref:glycoside hydrolase family 10 protein n=1 Tax=Catellatospora sp. KI3 TaxID=3041620 RepID=UPI00248248CC|nr:family 10 glycosylhydrolase [Catellatospora sp. KI3]MDI1462627.1 family 10 glycosylhydrolase [Catellatospora sp. KI3]
MRRRITAAAVTTALLGALLLPGGAQADPVAEGASAQGAADCVVNPALPKRQFRAMWIASVVNIDWPGAPGRNEETLKAEYRAWLDLAQRLNHNAVIVQVRPTADAFWPSPYEPWSEWLTGARDGNGPGWDPLAFLVSEAHARNLEFHAWFNPYRVSMPQGAGADPNLLAPNHPVRQHPEWALAYPVNAAGSRLYYNPGIPAVRAFVQDAIMDAVDRYDIDGVHFDDYFYPYPAAGQDFPDAATFAEYGADFASKADWRRHNIDVLIQELSGRIKASKPWVKFGVSPFGIWRNKASDPLGSETNGTQSYDANFADTRKWVKEGWLDYIVPQVYWSMGFAVADYAKLVPWWSDVVTGTDTQLYIGQADYKINLAGQPAAWFDPYEMSKHITFNRDYNVAGSVHFSAKDVKANRLGATDIVAAEQYSRPALVPAMSHLPAEPLMFPVVTSAVRQAGGIDLAWRPIADDLGPFGKAASYAVYRFDGFQPRLGACDLADASHLVTTTRGTSFTDTTAVPGQRYTYYVTSVDRLWNESPASPPRLVP